MPTTSASALARKLVGPALVVALAYPISCAASDAEVAPRSAPTFGAGELLGFGTSLLVVIAAILLLAWLYKRSNAFRTGGTDVINIIAAQSLGPKERILLVDVAGEQLVLGMTATQVQTLHVMSEPVEEAAPSVKGAGFAERLRAVLPGAGR